MSYTFSAEEYPVMPVASVSDAVRRGVMVDSAHCDDAERFVTGSIIDTIGGNFMEILEGFNNIDYPGVSEGYAAPQRRRVAAMLKTVSKKDRRAVVKEILRAATDRAQDNQLWGIELLEMNYRREHGRGSRDPS